MTDPGGYFFIPLIPQDEPFVAVAYDQGSGATRRFAGVGPQVGKSVRMFFDFARPQAEAAMARWDGGGDGTTWSNALNWETDILPRPDQDVLLDVPGNTTVTVDPLFHGSVRSLRSAEHLLIAGGSLGLLQSSTITGPLTLASGTLEIAGELRIGGLFTWQGGTMAGAGPTLPTGGLALTGPGSKVLNGRRLEIATSATWNGGSLTAINGALVLNRAGASFTISHDAQFYTDTSQGLGTFVNAGTLVRNGSDGVAHILLPFTNMGQVRVERGQLRLNESGTHSGSFGGAGVLEFSGGTHNLAMGSSLRGNLLFSGGTTTMEGSYATDSTTIGLGTLVLGIGATTATLTQRSGVLEGAGTLTVSGRFTWEGGAQRGAGQTIAAGGMELIGGAKVLDGRRLENGGAAFWRAGALGGSNGGQLMNRAGATFTITHDASFSLGTGQASFVNAGTLVRNTGAGIALIGVEFTSSGAVTVASGTLQFNGAGRNSGTITIGGGNTLDLNNAFVNETTGRIAGTGTLDTRFATFTNNGVVEPTVIIVS